MKEVLYKIEKLSKNYGQGSGLTKALDDVNLEIYKGELLCILGGSGSGKSTLLNLLGGIDNPSSGCIYFNNKDISKLKGKELVLYRRKTIGFIFQFFNLLDELNVYQNLTLIPGSNKKKEDVIDLLKQVGLHNALKKYPRELSGGEQQRVSIARALNKPSEILLADEPTGALDYKTGKGILCLIEKLHKEGNKTILLVTHNPNIAKMCDRTIEMKSGKIIGVKVNSKKIPAAEIDW